MWHGCRYKPVIVLEHSGNLVAELEDLGTLVFWVDISLRLIGGLLWLVALVSLLLLVVLALLLLLWNIRRPWLSCISWRRVSFASHGINVEAITLRQVIQLA